MPAEIAFIAASQYHLLDMLVVSTLSAHADPGSQYRLKRQSNRIADLCSKKTVAAIMQAHVGLLVVLGTL